MIFYVFFFFFHMHWSIEVLEITYTHRIHVKTSFKFQRHICLDFHFFINTQAVVPPVNISQAWSQMCTLSYFPAGLCHSFPRVRWYLSSSSVLLSCLLPGPGQSSGRGKPSTDLPYFVLIPHQTQISGRSSSSLTQEQCSCLFCNSLKILVTYIWFCEF